MVRESEITIVHLLRKQLHIRKRNMLAIKASNLQCVVEVVTAKKCTL